VRLLLFAAVVPGALGLIPVAALAALLVHAGCKLVPVRGLWRGHRGEVVVLVVTAGAIVVRDLFEEVLVGLALAVAVAKTAWDASHVHVETEDRGRPGSSYGSWGMRRSYGGRSCCTRWRRCRRIGRCGWNWTGCGMWITRVRRRWRGGPRAGAGVGGEWGAVVRGRPWWRGRRCGGWVEAGDRQGRMGGDSWSRERQEGR
jgi:hypothetical protein